VNDYIFDGDYILLREDGTVRTNEGYPVLQYATGKFWVKNYTHIFKAKTPYNNFFIWNFLSKKNIDRMQPHNKDIKYLLSFCFFAFLIEELACCHIFQYHHLAPLPPNPVTQFYNMLLENSG
jgi:hypothetical protein